MKASLYRAICTVPESLQLLNEHFCESIIIVKHKITQNCESAVFIDLPPEIMIDNCNFNLFYNMTPEVAILDAGRHSSIE